MQKFLRKGEDVHGERGDPLAGTVDCFFTHRDSDRGTYDHLAGGRSLSRIACAARGIELLVAVWNLRRGDVFADCLYTPIRGEAVAGTQTLEPGTLAKVVNISGVKLIVEKFEEE